MATWSSRGLRGSTFEEFINYTNKMYADKGLSLVQKIPTPITPVKMSSDHSQITLAYFEKQSTVDYIGAVQGIPICFDAKECAKDTFPLANIHEHQYEFMQNMEKQEGISFILIYFSQRNILYYMRFLELKKFIERMKNNGRKSIKIDELDSEFFFEIERAMVPYLKMIQKDINQR